MTKKNNTHIDSATTTIERAEIIKKKYFLYKSYEKYYLLINSLLSPHNKYKKIVELGSGGGFIKEIIPGVMTSDIQKLPGIDKTFSATNIPYKENTVNALVMINVLHHIDNVDIFFKEADRCLKNQGQIIMIEPALTLFGICIYKYFHHEPYKPNSVWKFKSTGPLSGANSALPWILFYRDRKKFENKYPTFRINKLYAQDPLLYLLSGGFSFRQLLPDFCYPLVTFAEWVLTPFHRFLGLFYVIEIEKVNR